MNNLYVLGRVYWILKNTGNRNQKIISSGFMRQTSKPWLTGKGVQLRMGKYVLQIGICGAPKDLPEQDGLLYAMQGRVMDIDVEKIGEW